MYKMMERRKEIAEDEECNEGNRGDKVGLMLLGCWHACFIVEIVLGLLDE